MSKRILFIESDLRFANEITAGFERVGAKVEVIGDGPSGLDRALVNRPDLILLTIELPGMNGFLVCKKIKKTAGLTEIPLIILSSEASEETFDQHKKLKTHAEDYLHKPVAVDELIESARKFIPLAAAEGGLDQGTLEITNDELILESEIPPPPPSESTELQAAQEQPTSERPLSKMPLSERPLSEPTFPIEPLGPSGRAVSFEPVLEFDSAHPSASPVSGEPEAAGIFSIPAGSGLPEIVPLDGSASDDVVELQRELERVKHQLTTTENALHEARSVKSRESGISGREFLDLRERLNRKDRELLDLRDQITARDKQLIESNDNILKVERALQDATERNQTLEREADKARSMIETLSADKESIRKRHDDFKARLERTDAKLKTRETELSQLEVTRTKEVEELRNEMARRLAEESDERQTALERLRETLQSDAADKLREVEEKHRGELDAGQSKHEQELRTLREELEGRCTAEAQAVREQLENQYAADTQARIQEHLQEMAHVNRKIFETETKLTASDEKLVKIQEVEKTLTEALDSATAERKAKETELSEMQARYQQELETLKNQHQEQFSAMEQRANSLETSLDTANRRMASDHQLFERLRESIVSWLGDIDQRGQE